MAKKRKTRQEKIILQLKRELARQQPQVLSGITKPKTRQEAKIHQPQKSSLKPTNGKKTDNSIFLSDPRLIRRDLTKTAALALITLSLQFVLYLWLR
jgi:hypothetical protein